MFFRRRRRYKEDRKSRDSGMVSIRYVPGRGGEIADWTYGNVWTRVYRNRYRKGNEIYYTAVNEPTKFSNDRHIALDEDVTALTEWRGDLYFFTNRAIWVMREKLNVVSIELMDRSYGTIYPDSVVAGNEAMDLHRWTAEAYPPVDGTHAAADWQVAADGQL